MTWGGFYQKELPSFYKYSGHLCDVHNFAT